MGLFGDFAFKESKKPKITLLGLAEDRFKEDRKLIEEIRLYLKSRNEQHNMPSRTSWKMQLDLLELVEKDKRASQVHTATLRGWRQIAYEKENNGVKRDKTHLNISNIGF